MAEQEKGVDVKSGIEQPELLTREAANGFPVLLFDQASSSDDQKIHPIRSESREKPENEGAEGIVRAEAKTIRNLRLAVIVLITAAAASCGFLIYKLSSKNETDSFNSTYEEAASKLTHSFVTTLFENLNYAWIMSSVLSSRLYLDSDYKPLFPNVTIAQFDTITTPMRNRGFFTAIIWSPLLFTHQEGRQWEEYALSKLVNKSESSSSTTGQYSACHFCEEGYTFANPQTTITFPGIETVTCALVEKGGLGGYISPAQCSYYKPEVQATCGCQKSTESSNATTATSAENSTSNLTSDGIFMLADGEAVRDRLPPPYSPVWQLTPSFRNTPVILFDQMSEPFRRAAITRMINDRTGSFSKTVFPKQDNIYQLGNFITNGGLAVSFFFPVFQSTGSADLAGSLSFDIPWINLLNNLLPSNSEGLTLVLENTMNQTFTYQIGGGTVHFQGEGDLHDKAFDLMMVESSYDDFGELLIQTAPPQDVNQTLSYKSQCLYRIRIYPTVKFQAQHVTNKPVIFTVIVVLAFAVTSIVFLAYDYIVRRLQCRVLDSAKRSEEIVSSLFPALVRDRLFRNAKRPRALPSSRFDIPLLNHKARLRTLLSQPPSLDMFTESEPIADLYPNATVLFADIAGFTAWSSEREPSQVFKLLESLYSEFDSIARELGVFKVETIGDCYVAVTGLPDKMKHHAAVMVRFAFRCLERMHELVSQLELVLGPGTADLTMRVGLHSGPVTAGVLRGERARFQLFGDTVNVASRMESTGKPDRIHLSNETAQLLIDEGKEHLVLRRKELVSAKGKGQLQTYWAKNRPFKRCNETGAPDDKTLPGTLTASRITVDGTDSGVWGAMTLENALAAKVSLSSSQDRLVEWTTDLLQRLLQKIVAKRNPSAKYRTARMSTTEYDSTKDHDIQFVKEITEVIHMPDVDGRKAGDLNLVDLEPAVRCQLRDFVSCMASKYRRNPFHNFEHACHVAMSASKLLKRIIAPDDMDYKVELGNNGKDQKKLSREIHETTFGISSDPLMQFSVIFSALIHDVDHMGVTNKQLVMENDPLAIKYQNKCIAEQRSIEVAWDTLMEDRFTELRKCIFLSQDERQRFRQLLVNAVIATDIADKELSAWRKYRWDKVFHQETIATDTETIIRDRKATIVFEYIIQASDVAHTMQHWHVYQKWNRRLFEERYSAYLGGREPIDPSIGWHKGEICFFDNYIIPLAKKLEECNVFGVSCDEYLTYAMQNRNEWEVKGEEIVREMIASFEGAMDDDDFAKDPSLRKNSLCCSDSPSIS